MTFFELGSNDMEQVDRQTDRQARPITWLDSKKL